MNGENRLLKWIVVIVPVVGAVLAILPPQDRLKGGIDLVGGCSLFYEIDTTGLERDQIRGLSEHLEAAGRSERPTEPGLAAGGQHASGDSDAAPAEASP